MVGTVGVLAEEVVPVSVAVQKAGCGPAASNPKCWRVPTSIWRLLSTRVVKVVEGTI